ncbi:MAG: 16S rRNA (uracil(1498)-N(3))-methyltransferase, partial [Bifidobacteriaceae bacterium]|nr:16S rRNA (uracil(1498)-N(3))-methyltransferase [Bifidobacteriaceae bacterium]
MTPLEYLVPPGALDDAGTHAHIDLTGSEAHHAVRVQRLAVGEWVDVVDGAGVRVRGVVEAVSGAEPRSTPRRVLPPPRSDPLPRGDTGEELREDSTRPSPSSSGRSLTGEELREDSTRPSPSRISRSPRGRPPRGVPGTGPRGGDPVLRLRVAEVSREVNDAAGIVLIQALAKGGRDEMAVEAATGLGVARIVPWAAARSVVRWPGPKAQRGRER